MNIRTLNNTLENAITNAQFENFGGTRNEEENGKVTWNFPDFAGEEALEEIDELVAKHNSEPTTIEVKIGTRYVPNTTQILLAGFVLNNDLKVAKSVVLVKGRIEQYMRDGLHSNSFSPDSVLRLQIPKDFLVDIDANLYTYEIL